MAKATIKNSCRMINGVEICFDEKDIIPPARKISNAELLRGFVRLSKSNPLKVEHE